jgi:hypothetical protein
MKGIPSLSVESPEELKAAIQNNFVSKAAILGRIAEMFDPGGLWEPVKVQCKLAFKRLNAIDWTDPVPLSETETWVRLLPLIADTVACTVPRHAFSPNVLPNAPIRLICLADAGQTCGGTAIYGGVELPDGSWTCQLLYAKSRLMNDTVPRNELSSICLMAEAALLVRKALGPRVKETHYFSDSMIAVCWVLNTTKRLRMWVHNRVTSARTAMRWTVGNTETLPLYHIPGTDNIADLLTKPHDITTFDVQDQAPWQCGLPWMKRSTPELPKNQFLHPSDSEEAEEFQKESFVDISAAHNMGAPLDEDMLAFGEQPSMPIQCSALLIVDPASWIPRSPSAPPASTTKPLGGNLLLQPSADEILKSNQ